MSQEIKFTRAGILARCAAPGYEDEVLRMGRQDGGFVFLTAEQLAELRLKFGPAKPHSAEPSLPPTLTMAGNALRAAGRTASAVVNGEAVYAPEGEFERRLAICKGQEATTETDGSASRPYQAACEFYLPEQGRCSECGCFVEKKVIGKCRLAREECPKGKWGKFEPQMVDTSPHPSPRERGEGEDNGRVQ